MRTLPLFVQSEENYEKMLKEIQDCKTSAPAIQDYEKIILKIDHHIRILKNLVETYEFESAASEIHFFKNIKPKYIAEFIYYAELLSIEMSKPQTGKKNIKKYYDSVSARINRFYIENEAFIQYIRRDARYLDQAYFCRRRYDVKIHFHEYMHSLDERFSTSHDATLAKLLASEKINVYIQEKIMELNQNAQAFTVKKVSWTASKASLTELIYALYITKSLHTGHGNLSDLIYLAEQIMDVKLDQFHKILGEIKARKIVRSKFLTHLQESLEQHFSNEDAL